MWLGLNWPKNLFGHLWRLNLTVQSAQEKVGKDPHIGDALWPSDNKYERYTEMNFTE